MLREHLEPDRAAVVLERAAEVGDRQVNGAHRRRCGKPLHALSVDRRDRSAGRCPARKLAAAMLPEESEVVVVGGGIVGVAALHYLVELGCERPVLLERETLGSGSTGRCAGGVRTLFSDELNIQIGLESIRRLERFETAVGEGP